MNTLFAFLKFMMISSFLAAVLCSVLMFFAINKGENDEQ